MENPIKYTVIKTTGGRSTAHVVTYQELTQAIGELTLSCDETPFRRISESEFSGVERRVGNNEPLLVNHKLVFVKQ